MIGSGLMEASEEFIRDAFWLVQDQRKLSADRLKTIAGQPRTNADQCSLLLQDHQEVKAGLIKNEREFNQCSAVSMEIRTALMQINKISGGSYRIDMDKCRITAPWF